MFLPVPGVTPGRTARFRVSLFQHFPLIVNQTPSRHAPTLRPGQLVGLAYLPKFHQIGAKRIPVIL